MEFEADRMTGLVLTDEVVLPERDVVLEEQNQRVANNPRSRLGEQIEAALYLNHPYGKPVIGWRHEIEKLDRDDALEFYKRFYGPNNAVRGDRRRRRGRRGPRAGGGDLRQGREAARIRAAPAARRSRRRSSPRRLTLADPRVEQPSFSRSYLVPSFSTAKQRRIRSARSAVAHSRPRLEQPALTANW